MSKEELLKKIHADLQLNKIKSAIWTLDLPYWANIDVKKRLLEITCSVSIEQVRSHADKLKTDIIYETRGHGTSKPTDDFWSKVDSIIESISQFVKRK